MVTSLEDLTRQTERTNGLFVLSVWRVKSSDDIAIIHWLILCHGGMFDQRVAYELVRYTHTCTVIISVVKVCLKQRILNHVENVWEREGNNDRPTCTFISQTDIILQPSFVS